jgi:DNA repair protein RecO (recombination protein O)
MAFLINYTDMEKLRTEGVIVRALAFQESDKIFTAFTPDEGLATFFFKGAVSKKKGGQGSTSPLTAVELIYAKGRGEMYYCYEASPLNHNLGLRQNLAILEAACEMLKAVSATQMPGKAASDLYRLLLIYLEKLPEALDPTTISASFHLKTLRHEGLWHGQFLCSACGSELSDSFLAGGEAFCRQHAPSPAFVLTASEREGLHLLAFCRDIAMLAVLPMTAELAGKIKRLFDEIVAK